MRRPLFRVLALALAFGAWETLFAGFMADDLIQLAVLEGVSPAAGWTDRFHLYTIADGNPEHLRAMQDAGLFPWFMGPHFTMAFFRPLSSGLLWIDHAVFGLHPSGYCLHSVFWSCLLVAAADWILRRALPGRAGRLASLIFVLSGIQAIFCWTAARHVVVAAAFGFAALAAHMRWREDGWRPGRMLSVIALVLSLAASEVGVAVAVYLLAYEALGRSDSPRDRVQAALPSFVTVATYVLAWRAIGYGASVGGGYIDPLRDAGTFLFELPRRIAVLMGGVVLGGSADLWVLRPDWRSVIALAGACVSIGFIVLASAAAYAVVPEQRRALRWLGPATVLSAVPFAGTPIGSRCLLVPFVGGAALIAVVIECWRTQWLAVPGRRFRILGAAAGALAVVHLGFAPLNRLTTPVMLQRMLAGRAAAALGDAGLDPASIVEHTAIVLAAPDFIVGLHGPFYRVLHRLPMPAAWRVLSWAAGSHRFTRSAPNMLDMEVSGARTADAGLVLGSVVTLRGMEATVMAAGAPGPTRVRFRFDRSLDDPSLTLLARRDGRLQRVAVPPIGQAIVIP